MNKFSVFNLSVHHCSVVSNSGNLQTIALQAPLSTEFSRKEYWSGLPCPPPGDLPNPGIRPRSPILQVIPWPSEPPGKPNLTYRPYKFWSMTLFQLCLLPCLITLIHTTLSLFQFLPRDVLLPIPGPFLRTNIFGYMISLLLFFNTLIFRAQFFLSQP